MLRRVLPVSKAVLDRREAVISILPPGCLGVNGSPQGGELLLASEVVVLAHRSTGPLRARGACGGGGT